MDRLPWALGMDALWKGMDPGHPPLALEINRLSAWMGPRYELASMAPQDGRALGRNGPSAWIVPGHVWALGMDGPWALMGPWHGWPIWTVGMIWRWAGIDALGMDGL